MSRAIRTVGLSALIAFACSSEEPYEPTRSYYGDTARGDGTAGDPDRAPGEIPNFGPGILSVISVGGFSQVPPPVCTEGGFVDYNCDALLSTMDCPSSNQHIDYDPDDQSPCPVCVDPSASDPTTCNGWQVRYGEFLAHLISESCANWCDSTSDCFAWEIQNACGTFAWSLFGGIDEEPILFAEMFSEENCDGCGDAGQALYLRRPGSTQIEEAGGTAGHSPTGLLVAYRPECVEHQCVLVSDE